MPDDATLQIILEWKEQNAAAHAEVMRKLAEMTAVQTAANVASGNALSSIQALIGALPAWGQALVYVGGALAPVTAGLIAFAVGGAGALALMGGLALGFAAIGAAVLYLGGGGGVGAAAALTRATDQLTSARESLQEFDAAHKGALTTLQQQQREQLVENVAKAQNNYNDALARSQGPMGVLIGQLSAVKDAWAAQAAPMAATITQWIAQGIPALQQFGSAIMTWFGERLPAALSGIGSVFRSLAPDFQTFIQFLGATFDRVSPQMGAIFEGVIRNAMLPAVTGLISNLTRLSDWWQRELPVFAPLVRDVMGGAGTVIQATADKLGGLADWLSKTYNTAIGPILKAAIGGFSFGTGVGPQPLGGPTPPGKDAPWVVFFKDVAFWLEVVAGIAWNANWWLWSAFFVVLGQSLAALPAAFDNIGNSIQTGIIGPILDAIGALEGFFGYLATHRAPVLDSGYRDLGGGSTGNLSTSAHQRANQTGQSGNPNYQQGGAPGAPGGGGGGQNLSRVFNNTFNLTGQGVSDEAFARNAARILRQQLAT